MLANIPATLVVETGIHQTARAVLSAGRNQVGRSQDDDIVIADLRNPGTSFALEHRGRSVVLCAADAPIEFLGGKSLQCGQSRRCASGIRFSSGGIAFRLEIAALGPRTPISSTSSRFGSRMPVVATGLLAVITLTTFVSLKAMPAAVSSVDAKDAKEELTGSIPSASAQAVPSAAQRQRLALASLQQHLANVDLSSLSLTAKPDGSIEASGKISKDQEAAWREVGHWFDGIAGGQVVLVNAVSVAAAPQPLSIQAVWAGPNPYVIDGNGGKNFIGTTLPSGWTISDIDRTRVLVKRDDQVLSVRF
jgi:hypothetical protein